MRQEELKETVVEQQIKISKLERRDSGHLSNLPKAPEDRNMAVAAGIAKAEQGSDEAEKRVDEAAREKMDKVARARAETEASKKLEQEVKEKAEREAEKLARVEAKKVARLRAEKEAMERAEREAEKEKFEREEDERSRREKEVKEKAEGEAKEREEEEKKALVSNKVRSAWGSVAGRNARSRKTSALSQKEQKHEWTNTWDMPSTERGGLAGLAPTLTPAASGLFDSAGDFDFLSTGKEVSPGGTEEVELRTPVTKKGKNRSRSPSNLSELSTSMETADVGKPVVLEDLNTNNMSTMTPVPSRSENERWTNAEQGPSPAEQTSPTPVPEPSPCFEASMAITSVLLGTPKGVEDKVPTAPEPLPAPSLPLARQSLVPTSTPPTLPAKTEPEKPLSLWDRKKLEVANPPAPAPGSGLFGGGDGANSPGVLGDASGGGGKGESIAMPATVGGCQSVFIDTARDRTRENQRENVVEGLLSSGAARRRNDPALSQYPVKPALASQKSGGWGSWGSSLLNIASTITALDRSPSPEPPPFKPKIENPPRGFTPSQPPKSQPAGLGLVKKPAWGAGGLGDNNAWGAAKPGPTPIAQKTSTGPAWGAKPAVSTFDSGTTGWGAGTGPSFDSGVRKNLSVDTPTKPLESSPNIAGPVDIPESAVEIKHVPAPVWFGGAIVDVHGDAPTQHTEPEPRSEVAEEPVKTEEVATPAEEDEFDWANTTKKSKKKSQVNSVANAPSVPNTPDPEDGGNTCGGAGAKKKKKGRR